MTFEGAFQSKILYDAMIWDFFSFLIFLFSEWKTYVCMEWLTERQIKEHALLVYLRPNQIY